MKTSSFIQNLSKNALIFSKPNAKDQPQFGTPFHSLLRRFIHASFGSTLLKLIHEL